MPAKYVFSGALAVAVASSLLSAPALAQSVDPVQPPPSASSLVAATNAMLRPDDVVGPLVAPGESSSSESSTGFSNPPEVGDMGYFVCDYDQPESESQRVRANQRESNAIATGFFAKAEPVEQRMYQYPSEAAAQLVWAALGDAIARGCVGGSPVRDESDEAKAEQIPGIAVPGWAVTRSGEGPDYETVHLVGDAIQLVSFNAGGEEMPRQAPGAVEELSVVLAQRWLERATLPLTQEPTLTRAEERMLQPGDVPQSMPILSPQAGAWSEFTFRRPVLNALEPCLSESETTAPAAERSVSAGLGIPGFSLPVTRDGDVRQRVDVFASEDAARQAWEIFSSQAKRCSRGQDEPVVGNEDLNRLTSGVSELTFDGIPGIWVRELGTSSGREFFRSKSYTISLLMGDAIQQVTYRTGRPGLGQVPLDQLPVNQLAENLANRWVAAGAQ